MTTENQKAAEKPAFDYIAYTVEKRGKRNAEKTYWTRIGVGWYHDDGEGFTAKLSALPLDGRDRLPQAPARRHAGRSGRTARGTGGGRRVSAYFFFQAAPHSRRRFFFICARSRASNSSPLTKS